MGLMKYYKPIAYVLNLTSLVKALTHNKALLQRLKQVITNMIRDVFLILMQLIFF